MEKKIAIIGCGKLGSSLVEALRGYELNVIQRKDSSSIRNKAVRNSELVCVVIRPEQVRRLLEEIDEYLDETKLLVNFSTKDLESNYPLINVACSPVIDNSIKVLAYAKNSKVKKDHFEKFRRTFEPVSGHFFECENSTTELANMSRVYCHLLHYYQLLADKGINSARLTSYFELATTTIVKNPDVKRVKRKASTKKGLTEAVFSFYETDSGFDELVEKESEILNRRLKWIQEE
jgi:hypothetical protein